MQKSKYSVFIVDDEKLIRMGLRQLIDWDACGFSVCGEAANGKDAIPEIMSKEVDLVLTDIKMPGINGIELAKIIARERPDCYVIIMTGFGELSYAKEAIKANVFDFLQKPVDPEELEATVCRLYDILQSRSIPYPFEEENKLILAITSSNGDMAMNTLDNVIKKISASHITEDKQVLLYRKLLETATKKYSEICPARLYIEPPTISDECTAELAAEMIKEYFMDIFYSEKSISANALVEKIKLFLQNNYKNDITLSTLANEFYSNPTYISRIFKQYTGVGYRTYLINIRINYAKQLLATTNYSVLQISEMIGFGNPTNFGRAFREATGVQPIEYRNENRK